MARRYDSTDLRHFFSLLVFILHFNNFFMFLRKKIIKVQVRKSCIKKVIKSKIVKSCGRVFRFATNEGGKLKIKLNCT